MSYPFQDTSRQAVGSPRCIFIERPAFLIGRQRVHIVPSKADNRAPSLKYLSIISAYMKPWVV
jgi:hypothetical protein